MNLAERQQRFVEAVRKRFDATKATRLSRLFGVSNSAKIIEGGVQIGVPNLDAANENDDGFIFACVMKFPPEDEVYFAIYVRTDRTALVARLIEMKSLGTGAKAPAGDEEGKDEDDEEAAAAPAAGMKYSARNNLVASYVGHDGKLYFRNSRFWNSLNFDLSTVGPGVVPDQVVVSLYPPAASARRSLLAREFVGYLGNLIGPQKVHEINVWPDDDSSIGDTMRRLPATIPLAEIEASVAKLGGYYPGGEVRRFHTALNFLPHKHFVILSGLSGTGKTQLALKYARAVHGVETNHGPDPLLFVCPVRPEWTDPTGLTGYDDVLSGQYVVPPFLEAVLVATAQRDSPVFVLLDEMNLARIEYFFSDVLSCIETGSPLQLHSKSVPLEGSTGGTIRAELPLPHNLYIVGTINVDETTNPVSDKILDRASVIEMTDVNLTGFLDDLGARVPELKAASDACREELAGVHGLMAAHNLGFGYRVAEEFVRYYDFAAAKLGGDPIQVIDDLMVQKVLVKLRGGEGQRALLAGLAARFAGRPRSRGFVERLTADLDEFGSFQTAR